MLDDGFRLSWPAFGETVAAYPSVRLIRKGGRAWTSALQEAADLAKHNIRVNAVIPGFIMTNIFAAGLGLEGAARDHVNGMIAQAAVKAQPVQRAGRPEDIAAAVAFLASDDAAFVTGTHILVDGGMMVGTRASWDDSMPGLFASLEAASA